LFAVVAFATGGIVARLRAANAARMRIFIGILYFWSDEMSGFDGREDGRMELI
jgi:hypothetical protein